MSIVTNIIEEQCVLYLKLIKVKKKNPQVSLYNLKNKQEFIIWN